MGLGGSPLILFVRALDHICGMEGFGQRAPLLGPQRIKLVVLLPGAGRAIR